MRLMNRCRIKTKKRHRYSLLRDEDQEERDDLELMQKGKVMKNRKQTVRKHACINSMHEIV